MHNGTRLIVTLTATANQYLAPRLPLRGLLRINEMRTDGYAQPRCVTFQEIGSDGQTIGAEVMADYAEFSYAFPRTS